MLAFLASTAALQAQNVGINTTGARPDTSTILDLNTGNSGHAGFLPEQVALQSASDAATIFMPANGLFVYNTGTGGLTPAGYYYNSGTSGSPNWVKLLTGVGGGSGWSLTGNAGTNATSNFIGTTDGNALQFIVNNLQSGWIDYTSPYNSFFGYGSGLQMTLYGSGGNSNTGVGYEALDSTTATNNTAIGALALYGDLGGYNNTAGGAQALQHTSVGNANTSFGAQSSVANTTGGANTAMGYQALQNSVNGNYNTAIGNAALFTETAASSNTALGFDAGYNNTSSLNVFVGDSAGYNNTSGTQNTFVGYQAGAVPVYAAVNNSIFLGFRSGVGAATASSNTIYLGNSSTTTLFSAAPAINSYSDRRIKDNVQENVPGLAFITKLHPVTYHINIDKENKILGVKDDKDFKGKYDIEKITQSGFIAQDVEAAANACGYNFCGVVKPETKDGLYSLGYTYFIMPLVKAVQEQQQMIDSLKTANNAMSKEEKDLKTANASLQTAETKNEKDIAELRKLVYILTEKAEATDTKK